MPPAGCPKCGAVEGTVLGPVGELLSCKQCEEASQVAAKSQERTDRKDEAEKLALEANRRQANKDSADIGAKIAGVALAAGALASSIFGKKDQQKPAPDQARSPKINTTTPNPEA
jgi:uncharacterized Zn finger protein (UPF0148 family)